MNKCFTRAAVVLHLSSAFVVPPPSKGGTVLGANREMSDACSSLTWHLDLSANASSSSELLHHLMNTKETQPEPISASRKEMGNVKTIFYDTSYGFGFTPGLINGCPALCNVTDDPEALQQPVAAIVKNAIWGHNIGGTDDDMDALVARRTKVLINFFYEGVTHYNGHKKDLRKWTNLMQGVVDWTLHYATDSDFSQRMVSFEKKTCRGSNMFRKTNYAAGRRFTMMWMTKDCGPRLDFAVALQKRLGADQFHIYTTSCPVPDARKVPCDGFDESDECYQQLFSQYKFYASFENLRCDGYITEKFHRGFLEGMVPVVLGGRNRSDVAIIAPNASFVHTDEFNSYDEMAHYLATISDDDYNKYHKWRSTHRVKTMRETNDDSWCSLCKELHKSPSEQKPKFTGDLTARIFGISGESCTDRIPDWAA